MKRSTFLLISIIIVFILVLVWVYLLFFGTPNNENDSIFSNFNFGGSNEINHDENVGDGVADVVVDTASQERLRQLTTVPVLAYREVITSSTTPPNIYYIEAGTGHIFSINYETGQTTRLSATTIPVASKAAMSPNGQFIMIQSGDGAGAEFVVGNLATSSEKIDTTTINENIVDFVIPNDTEILYGVQQQDSYVGKRYSLTSGQSSTLFTIPFREVSVSWGASSDATHYVYPKATNQLTGFVYAVRGGSLRRLPVDGYGLSAIGLAETLLYSNVITTNVERLYATVLYDTDTQAEIPLIPIIPEKCTATDKDTFVCAAPFGLETTIDLPDSWYQGVITTDDFLWEIDPATNLTRSLVSLSNASGRAIDATNLVTNPNTDRVYFQHRHNRLLWVYELTE